MAIENIISSEWSLSIDEQGKIVQGLQDIAQCIYIILTTRKGTDPLRPEFGCDAFLYVDKPATIGIANMKREIMNAIKQFEPRANLKSVKHVLEVSAVTFNITFSVTNSVETGQIDVTYGLN